MNTNPAPEPQAGNPILAPSAHGPGQTASENRLQQQGQAKAEEPCLHCGGSGILRKNSESYRTCLTCLGQGAPLSTKGLLFPMIRPVSSPAASR